MCCLMTEAVNARPILPSKLLLVKENSVKMVFQMSARVFLLQRVLRCSSDLKFRSNVADVTRMRL